jgi:hypothetical protein
MRGLEMSRILKQPEKVLRIELGEGELAWRTVMPWGFRASYWGHWGEEVVQSTSSERGNAVLGEGGGAKLPSFPVMAGIGMGMGNGKWGTERKGRDGNFKRQMYERGYANKVL